MRLDQLLKKAGYTSRKSQKQLLAQGLVTINGQIARQGRQNVDARLQTIKIGEQQVSDNSQVYYILNKPAGYVTAVKDNQKPTVFDLIAESDQKAGLYHIGRLDADTEGLLLVTNNGPLGLRMLHPRHHVLKTYLVEVNGKLDWTSILRFDQGIVFRDGTACRPARLEILSSQIGFSRAQLTIREGKFHQVKKMFLAIGVKVTYLKRIGFGPFILEDTLPTGHYRRLTPSEEEALLDFFD